MCWSRAPFIIRSEGKLFKTTTVIQKIYDIKSNSCACRLLNGSSTVVFKTFIIYEICGKTGFCHDQSSNASDSRVRSRPVSGLCGGQPTFVLLVERHTRSQVATLCTGGHVSLWRTILMFCVLLNIQHVPAG